MLWLWGVCAALALIACGLVARLALLRRDLNDICVQLQRLLEEDSNILISTSSADRAVRRLAVRLNGQLRQLRDARNRLEGGKLELQEAVANVSHDLRTPLTGICGYLDLLEREKKSETVARYLQIISGRVQALRSLMEELFQYSVTNSNLKEFKMERVNLVAALEENLLANYSVLAARGIEPEIDLPEAPVFRMLNQEALNRVLSNVISNAAKYSDGDLRVVLTPDGKLCFSNEARTLDEIQLGRLFDRFYTVEAGNCATGLGLFIARTLMQRMGGSIWAIFSKGRLEVHLCFRKEDGENGENGEK